MFLILSQPAVVLNFFPQESSTPGVSDCISSDDDLPKVDFGGKVYCMLSDVTINVHCHCRVAVTQAWLRDEH